MGLKPYDYLPPPPYRDIKPRLFVKNMMFRLGIYAGSYSGQLDKVSRSPTGHGVFFADGRGDLAEGHWANGDFVRGRFMDVEKGEVSHG